MASSIGASPGRAAIKQTEDTNGTAQRRLTAVIPRSLLTGPSGRTNAAAAEVVGWLTTGRRTAALKSSPLSLLWDVLKYARFLNPKEFELPKDLMPGIKIPGNGALFSPSILIRVLSLYSSEPIVLDYTY